MADVRAVEYDSRRVTDGALFFCLTGSVSDGHDYAEEALERGAVGLVCERPLDLRVGSDVPVVQVPPGTARQAMARAAAALQGHPAHDLLMVGVTGTNGKTTVTHLLGEILGRAGHAATVIGTLGGARTTPEAPELQVLLAQARDRASAEGRLGAVAMEVSSHALAQSRVDGITFDIAVFTNLSHDHLDFHGTMDAYGQAKASLFTPERARRGVVWADDPWGDHIRRSARIPVIAVRREAAQHVTIAPGRTTFMWRGQDVELSLVRRGQRDQRPDRCRDRGHPRRGPGRGLRGPCPGAARPGSHGAGGRAGTGGSTVHRARGLRPYPRESASRAARRPPDDRSGRTGARGLWLRWGPRSARSVR